LVRQILNSLCGLEQQIQVSQHVDGFIVDNKLKKFCPGIDVQKKLKITKDGRMTSRDALLLLRRRQKVQQTSFPT
jgi:hypothetical protein